MSGDDQDPSLSETLVAPTSPAPEPGALGSNGPELLAGRYEMLGLLGRGAMGAVYRVRDRELDEVVALKVLNRELASTPELIERFRREVKLARRVTHPNVARTFDIGEHAGTKFLTMEYIDGQALGSLVRRTGRLPVRRVIEIGAALCRGLSAAHAAGVVHRDLKPDNVIIARDGRVVITDFGIARDPLSVNAAATAGGGLVGTPAYMAPEQVEGKSAIDARTDIYALGVVLFELLTGELPWQGSSVIMIAMARLDGAAPDPRRRCPDLPAAVADAVLRCLARQPSDRFADATQVETALAAATPTLEAGAASRSVPPRASVAPAAGYERSIAVLPFRNQGPPEDAYLAEGLSDDLIDTLSVMPGLRVRPRGAVARYKGVDADPRLIGRDLEVEVVVDGSVRRAGERVRLTARLSSVHDGFQLWAHRFERPANDLLLVSDETAVAIAGALAVTAGAMQERPRDPVAVDLYLKGRAELLRAGRPNTERAVALLRQAHSIAPDDVAILTAFAKACTRQWFFVGRGGDEAVSLAERAAAMAPRDAGAQLALAGVRLLEGDLDGCASGCRRALSLAADDPEVQEFCGRLLLEASMPERAIGYFESALRSDPELTSAWLELMRAHALLGDPAQALSVFRTWHRPGEPGLGEMILRSRLALWSPELRPLLDGLVIPEDAPLGSPWGVAHAARTLANGGDPSVLVKLVDSMGTLQAASRFFVAAWQVVTEFAAYTGDVDMAFGLLERSTSAGLFDSTWLAKCPVLEPLRSDPRFEPIRQVVERRAERMREVLGVSESGAIRRSALG